jgi:carbamoyltransferase
MLIVGAPSIHNPTWTLLDGPRPVLSVEEDRLHREKNRFGLVDADGRVNVLAGWAYILENMRPTEIDFIAFGFNPSATYFPGAFDRRHEHFYQERVFVQQALLLNELRRAGWKGDAYYIRHHLAHASAVYYLSPFDEAAIISVDGWGEDETISISYGHGTAISTLATVTLPESIGEAYTRLTTKLGWGMDDAGKTMALAAYGTPARLAVPLFDLSDSTATHLSIRTHSALKFVESVPPCAIGESLSEVHASAAATIQIELERAMLTLAHWAQVRTGSKNLCLSGGVALNCVANHRVAAESTFRSVFVQPACGDSGIPMGAALAVQYSLEPTSTRHLFTAPYLGRRYNRHSYLEALSGLPTKEYPDDRSLCLTVAKLLANGLIVGWFQGRSEYGPRALGNRSILADPRRREMGERLNVAVKRRESFRPFAPSVIAERATDYFQLEGSSPFMLFAAPVRGKMKDSIPAVVHIDGTARVQTVSRQSNPLFYLLIESFWEQSGVPMVVNTSLNTAGDPMVESPWDAVECFRKTELDVLVVGRFIARRHTNA